MSDVLVVDEPTELLRAVLGRRRPIALRAVQLVDAGRERDGLVVDLLQRRPRHRRRGVEEPVGVDDQVPVPIVGEEQGVLRSGRVKADDLARCGVSRGDLDAGSAAVRRVVELECGRARDFYSRAVAARPPEDRRRLVAAEIMRAVYFETLNRIERNGYDVFTARARVPRPRQALIALRQWLWPA